MEQNTMTEDGRIEAKVKQRGLTIETDAVQLAMSLKTYRLRKGLTQSQLAAQWGCSRHTIMRLEGTKKTTWEMMYRVFNHLNEAMMQETLEKQQVQRLP